MMQYVIRKWNCGNCGRSNATEIALDGTVKCDYCAEVMKIQPSGAHGGETRDQLAAFIRADATTRQGARRESAGWRAFRDDAPATGD
jgi:DNA-directed RNA polymerase subunit RPC12/RpoP